MFFPAAIPLCNVFPNSPRLCIPRLLKCLADLAPLFIPPPTPLFILCYPYYSTYISTIITILIYIYIICIITLSINETNRLKIDKINNLRLHLAPPCHRLMRLLPRTHTPIFCLSTGRQPDNSFLSTHRQHGSK